MVEPKKQSLLKTMWKYRTRYLFLLPALILIFGIRYYNFAIAVYRSFFNWNGVNVSVFLGFENYANIFTDSRVIQAFQNVFIIAVAMVIINLIMPFLAAKLVYHIKARRFQNFLKTGFIVPMVVPTMVTILMWRWIYSGSMGILNQLLALVSLESLQRNWLADIQTALPSMIFVGFPWIAGLPFLLYLAGLINIPKEITESAQIDGVKPLTRLRYIDIPMIASQIKLVVIFIMIQAFQSFELAFILTGGGPGYRTTVPTMVIYDMAFNHNRFGYASAIGVVLFLTVLILTLINHRFIKSAEISD